MSDGTAVQIDPTSLMLAREALCFRIRDLQRSTGWSEQLSQRWSKELDLLRTAYAALGGTHSDYLPGNR